MPLVYQAILCIFCLMTNEGTKPMDIIVICVRLCNLIITLCLSRKMNKNLIYRIKRSIFLYLFRKTTRLCILITNVGHECKFDIGCVYSETIFNLTIQRVFLWDFQEKISAS